MSDYHTFTQSTKSIEHVRDGWKVEVGTSLDNSEESELIDIRFYGDNNVCETMTYDRECSILIANAILEHWKNTPKV